MFLTTVDPPLRLFSAFDSVRGEIGTGLRPLCIASFEIQLLPGPFWLFVCHPHTLRVGITYHFSVLLAERVTSLILDKQFYP